MRPRSKAWDEPDSGRTEWVDVQPRFKEPKAKKAKKVRGMARPDEPLRQWCEARIEGVCTGRANHRHHKVLRSRGGTDDRSNTADLCWACHGYIHANPRWAYGTGWIQRAAS